MAYKYEVECPLNPKALDLPEAKTIFAEIEILKQSFGPWLRKLILTEEAIKLWEELDCEEFYARSQNRTEDYKERKNEKRNLLDNAKQQYLQSRVVKILELLGLILLNREDLKTWESWLKLDFTAGYHDDYVSVHKTFRPHYDNYKRFISHKDHEGQTYNKMKLENFGKIFRLSEVSKALSVFEEMLKTSEVTGSCCFYTRSRWLFVMNKPCAEFAIFFKISNRVYLLVRIFAYDDSFTPNENNFVEQDKFLRPFEEIRKSVNSTLLLARGTNKDALARPRKEPRVFRLFGFEIKLAT